VRCPVASALDIVGDRWTLLIVRDLLCGTHHFNDLERGLPGISRALLARRLRQLQQVGIVEKHHNAQGQKTTAYTLTEAGNELQEVISALLTWGAMWAFGDPTHEQLDPVLLMWWMHNSVYRDQLPERTVTVEFHFHGTKFGLFWLLLNPDEVTLCLTDPGCEIDVAVSSDLSIFFQLWLGRIDYEDGLRCHNVRIDGAPELVEAFPTWFTWSLASYAVRAARTRRAALPG
jgi:DNA-binding HxlR family transcriptional regulator